MLLDFLYCLYSFFKVIKSHPTLLDCRLNLGLNRPFERGLGRRVIFPEND